MKNLNILSSHKKKVKICKIGTGIISNSLWIYLEIFYIKNKGIKIENDSEICIKITMQISIIVQKNSFK